jgi:hypothetical protein
VAERGTLIEQVYKLPKDLRIYAQQRICVNCDIAPGSNQAEYISTIAGKRSRVVVKKLGSLPTSSGIFSKLVRAFSSPLILRCGAPKAADSCALELFQCWGTEKISIKKCMHCKHHLEVKADKKGVSFF